jgi:hypothetical protein
MFTRFHRVFDGGRDLKPCAFKIISNELKYPALPVIQDKVKLQKYTEYTENT